MFMPAGWLIEAPRTSHTSRNLSSLPSLSLCRICTAEWVRHAHSYARVSRRRLILGNLDDFGPGTATLQVMSRIILARIPLTAAGTPEWLLSHVFAIHVAL